MTYKVPPRTAKQAEKKKAKLRPEQLARLKRFAQNFKKTTDDVKKSKHLH